jgi:hypothetical protein
MSDDFLNDILGLSDGTKVTVSETKEYESSSNSGYALFPNETSVRAALDEAKWFKDGNGKTRLSLRWVILAPEEYENRKVFQSLWIKDLEPNAEKADVGKAKLKRDKHRMMFAVIDANAGGKLAELIAKGTDINDEHLMAHLTNKPMVIRIDKIEPKDGDARNYIAKVSPKNAPISSPEEIAKGQAEMAKTAKPSGSSKRDLGDDIPF